MTTWPADTFWDSSKTEGEASAGWFYKTLDTWKELPGGAEQVAELTIASGVITPNADDASRGAAFSVDTEADAASDDLSAITVTNTPEGRLLFLRANNTARTVVVKHEAGGSGQISLIDNADFSLDDDKKWIGLILEGTTWKEVFRGEYPLTASRVIVTDTNGRKSASTTTSTELGYVSGVTSSIQTQFSAEAKATLTTTGDLLYASAANTLARLGIGTANKSLFVNSAGTAPEWSENVGLVETTRDLSDASGTQVVSGLNFKPRAIIIYSAVNGFVYSSWGMGSTTDNFSVYTNGAGTVDNFGVSNSACFYIYNSGSVFTTAVVSATTDSSLTLNFTKTGAHTGTAVIYIMYWR